MPRAFLTSIDDRRALAALTTSSTASSSITASMQSMGGLGEALEGDYDISDAQDSGGDKRGGKSDAHMSNTFCACYEPATRAASGHSLPRNITDVYPLAFFQSQTTASPRETILQRWGAAATHATWRC